MSWSARASTLALAAFVWMTPACRASGPPATAPSTSTLTMYDGPWTVGDLREGEAAPDFTTTDQDGHALRLSDLRGQKVVLFFYSKDEAPGPTREATAFRDSFTELKGYGATVIGVSTDSVSAHKDFAEHLRLPFPLVSDPDGTIGKAFGVDDTYGVLDYGTIVIDRDGKIARVYRNVDIPNHATEVRDAVANLEGAPQDGRSE